MIKLITDNLAHMANLALHCIYSFIYPVQYLSYLTLRIFSSASSRWSNLVLKGFYMLDALKQFLGCNVIWTENQHKFNGNSVVIILLHISCTTLRSQLLLCSMVSSLSYVKINLVSNLYNENQQPKDPYNLQSFHTFDALCMLYGITIWIHTIQ